MVSVFISKPMTDISVTVFFFSSENIIPLILHNFIYHIPPIITFPFQVTFMYKWIVNYIYFCTLFPS